MEKQNRLRLLLGHLLPDLKPTQYKGNSGKIAVIGGSQEYTGAPYYAAIAGLRSGSDLSHVICPIEASIPIKCYSPEIIVHSNTGKIIEWFNFSQTFVIGPGMGRTLEAEQQLINLIDEVQLQKKTLNLIFDADSLWFIQKNEVLQNAIKSLTNHNIVLTPNLIEFYRMQQSMGLQTNDTTDLELQFQKSISNLDTNNISRVPVDHQIIQQIADIANRLNCIIVRKGPLDLITDGKEALCVGTPGSLKRCGGIGDILSGVIGSFCQYSLRADSGFDLQNRKLESLVMACYVTRTASSYAFNEKKHSLTAPDIIEKLVKVVADAT